jgi:pimeloyl-ACP methyl ester carboxylesterase
MFPPRLAVLGGLVAAALVPATASAAVTKGPSGLAFYNPPAAKVAGPHGSLIWARPVTGSQQIPSAGKTWLVLYRSESPKGQSVPTSGLVTLPKGKAPKGGWPVVSWAHGTTGIADVCAPSRMLGASPNPYSTNLNGEFNDYLKRGYAIAQTDYQGLGTPGMHPYLIGKSEGRSVVDIVSAAHKLNAHVGKRWMAIGHSQGGHAVLWAASLGPGYAPGLRLEGALPLAPASHIGEQAQLISSIQGNPLGGLPALIVSAAAADIGADPATVFSDKAFALYPQIEQVCLDKLSQPDSFGGVALNELLRQGYDTTPLVNDLSANDPEDLTIKVPLLIAQGKADTTVLPNFTDQTVSELESHGAKVTYKTYDGIDHTGIVKASRSADEAFIKKHLG